MNCNDTMAIAGTEFVYTTHTADLAFFDTRNSNLLHAFTDSHGDDVTEVRKSNASFRVYGPIDSHSINYRSSVTLLFQHNSFLVQQTVWSTVTT